MRSSLVVLLLASLPCGVLAQSDRDWRLCRAVDADHLAIPACTRLIDSSGLSERDRATAHVIRGSAHWRQRDFDQAIADENEAIKIDPNLAAAYVARSAAYGSRRMTTSTSIRTSRRPTSTAALPAATRAMSTARSPTRPGRSSSIPTTRWA